MAGGGSGSSKPGNPNPHVGQTVSPMHPAQRSGTPAGSTKNPRDPHKSGSRNNANPNVTDA